jgi:hypothetical protein
LVAAAEEHQQKALDHRATMLLAQMAQQDKVTTVVLRQVTQQTKVVP